MMEGILVERAGERDALLLAAGELVAADVGLIQNTDLIQRGGEGGELLLLVEQAEEHAEEAHIRHHGGQNVLERRRAGDEVEGLEDHADLAAELAQRLAGELETSVSSTVNSPSVMSIMRLMVRISVDLPAPERPMMATNSPCSNLRLTSLRPP